MVLKINSTFERSHIYHGGSFEKLQKKREKSKLRLFSPVHFTKAKGKHIVEYLYVSGFHHSDHAKIWKAQKRVEVLDKWIYTDETSSNIWRKLDQGIYGERTKTLKWLEKKSQKYPEYWL